MYESFYGFGEKPFNVTPDSRFFFPSEKHEEALNSLFYAIQERIGFAVITGEIGSGKTTVWHKLVGKLDPGTKIALITNSNLSPKQMLMAILEDLEIPFSYSWPKVKLHSTLNRYLLEQISMGFNVVLIIDEAQNLKYSSLEEVRMISNLETDKEKLIQIVLMGQPELRDILAMKELEQLRQRISVYYHIKPLTREETNNYIQHRLKVASSNGQLVLDETSIDKVHECSGGVPRRINAICDRALLTGYIRGEKNITQEVIAEAAKEIDELISLGAEVQEEPQQTLF